MKIVEDTHIEYEIEAGITSASYISDYRISVHFEDGTSKLIDFETFLSKSQHPSIQKYLNIEKFKQFKIINGNLNWNNYDLIFPLSDLKKGTIQ
ncbi:DUF2442 domain-containing protein [uncultured Draconibacterium sp.]|uniref:DUF2442 domain-containing protein n=1 Tax=uncultured Draconibacterium sp. TaxID=1573823 RepID=UPI0032171DD5